MFEHKNRQSIEKLYEIIPKRKDFLTNNVMENHFYVFDTQNYISEMGEYVLVLYAVEASGKKVVVMIYDIPVYVDVRAPYEKILELLEGKKPKSHCSLLKKRFKGYQEEPFEVERLYFDNLEQREYCISKLKGFEMSNNIGAKKYAQFVARKYPITLLGWNTVKKITVGYSKLFKCDKVYKCGIEDIVMCKEQPIDVPLITMTLDIETFTNAIYAGAPKPDDDGSCTFLICCTFHRSSETEPFYKIALSSLDTDYEHTLRCKNERSILIALCVLIDNMDPDIITEFSGFAYDWPFILTKASQYFLSWKEGIVTVRDFLRSAMSNDYDWQKHKGSSPEPRIYTNDHFTNKYSSLKVVAGNTYHALYPSYPGKLCIDMRFIATRREMKESYQTQSLNYFLKKNGIPEKVDLHYQDLDKIYILHRLPEEERSRGKSGTYYNIHNMSQEELYKYYNLGGKAIEYCFYDALSTFLLLSKLDIIRDMHEEATLCKVSFRQCVYNAGGCKVLNNILCEPDSEKYMLDERPSKDVIKLKYTGGALFLPKCELHRDPVGDLDVNSEYPNVDIVYNMSPEMCITNEAEAMKMKAMGIELHEANFMAGLPGMPRDKVRCWFIQYNKKTEEGMGIFPKALLRLRQTRLELQAQMKKYEELVKILVSGQDVDSPLLNGAINKLAYAKFRMKCLDIAQNRRKILMNTFYGVTGSATSALFMLEIAGGITSTSVIITNLMAKTAVENGFSIVYGDTDSTYLKLDSSYYREIEEKYTDAKTCYAEKIKLYISKIKSLAVIVNKVFEEFTGSKYLAVKYEKTLCPAIFSGLKSYMGIKHENEPDLEICFGNGSFEDIIKRLHIKGSLTSPNMSKFSKRILEKVLSRAMNFNEKMDIVDIALDEIDIESKKERILKTQEDLLDFVRIGKNKPESSETHHIRKFIMNLQKMQEQFPELMMVIPNPGDRFRYLVADVPVDPYGDNNGNSAYYVTVDNFFNERYLKYIRKDKLGINLPSYFKECIGGLAKLLYRHPRFKNDELFGDEVNRERELFKEACKKAIKNVKNAIILERKCLFPSIKSKEAKTSRLNVLCDKLKDLRFTEISRDICKKALDKTQTSFKKYVEQRLRKHIKKYSLGRVWRIKCNLVYQFVNERYNDKLNQLMDVAEEIWRACSRVRLNRDPELPQDTINKLDELLNSCAYCGAVMETWSSDSVPESLRDFILNH